MRQHDVKTMAEKIPLFTRVELVTALKGTQNRKVPGLDEVSAEDVKEIIHTYLKVLPNGYNICLKKEILPQQWRTQSLVLINILN